MQQIDHWPEVPELNLPEAVFRDLHQQLILPFDSVDEVKQFWQETSSTLITLKPTDNITQLKNGDTWSQIEFARTYPEYTVPLSNGYVLLVAIVNDSGAGIYLAVPPELSPIIPE